MQQIGYSLVDATGKEIHVFGDISGRMEGIPSSVELSNGDIVFAPDSGQIFSDGSRLVQRWLIDVPPALWFDFIGASIMFDGQKVIKTMNYSTIANASKVSQVIKDECARRIYANASDNTQKNLAANAAAGNFVSSDLIAFKNSIEWIRAMQASCRQLIASQDATFADDSHWPPVPADALALAQRY